MHRDNSHNTGDVHTLRSLASRLTLVSVESPYQAPDAQTRQLYLDYARAALASCLANGEAPLASHLLYTQPGVLNDALPAQRQLGIAAGLAWNETAAATVVFIDHGISSGMRAGIEAARLVGRPVHYRSLDPVTGVAVAVHAPEAGL